MKSLRLNELDGRSVRPLQGEGPVLSRTTVGTVLVAGLLAGSSMTAAQRGPAAEAAELPPDVLAVACAPKASGGIPKGSVRVTGGQDSFPRPVYAPGDLITINAGTNNGIEVGQEYYTRRLLMPRQELATRTLPPTLVTSGWIRVYAVDDTMSLATVTHACDAIESGDHLEPFVLPAVPLISADKPKPERDNYGRVMTGSDRRGVFGKGDFLLVDRGSNDGIVPGSQFVLYRNKRQPENFLYDLGEAVAVGVAPGTSTLQVTLVRDTIETGDLVALRK